MRNPRLSLLAGALLAPIVVIAPTPLVSAVAPPDATVFVSELHYDNDGTDVGESIEIFAPTCTDLTGWSIELYNGNGGGVYDTTPLSGFVPDLGGGFGVVTVDYPSNGIQNGALDGLALIDDTGAVRQFLSYEGVVVPAAGTTAEGLTATELPVAETSSTPVGNSLQLQGTGSVYGDFTWAAGVNSFGAFGPDFVPAGVGGDPDSCDLGGGGDPADLIINEIHYDNEGTDTGEAVEIAGPADADLNGWTVVRYNGSNGTVYGTDALSGTLPDLGGGVGVTVVGYPTNGLQNGAPDGIALVDPTGEVAEFLSYEGSFTASAGPADGLTSTDIGVSESGSTRADQSLQRAGDGTWFGPACNSFGLPNDDSAPAECPEPSPVVLNAALISTAGSNDPEYVELFGTPGLSLDGYSVIGIESDDQSSNGNIDHRYDLGAGDEIGDNGFFLLGNTAVGAELGVQPDFEIPFNALENSSITIALAETASIAGGTAADVGVVFDSVGVTDGGANDSFAFGAPVVGPDGNFLPAGVRRIADGVDTDTAADWALLVFDPRDDPANVPTAGGGGGGDPELTLIHDIQGPGDASPIDGTRVLVEAVVTGAPDPDPDGVYETFGGFYLQEEDGDADADPLTSEGIFVFAGGNVTVQPGDVVRVVGDVDEFGGLTELTNIDPVEIIGQAPLPTAIELTFPVATDFDFEPLEGMLLTLPQTLVVSEYFNFDRFGETVVALPTAGADRPINPTALFDEDSSEAADLRDLNLRSRITIDDGQTAQNPDAPVHPFNRELFSLDNAFRGGDTVSDLTGPLHFAFGAYRLMPLANGDGFGSWDQTVAPAAPDDVGGNVTVATLNALNYFLTLDDGVNDICGPNQDLECRGADADQPDEFARQRVKLLNVLEGLDADIVGLVELENRPGVEALADIVAGLNERLGAGTYDYVAAGTDAVVGTDAIKVGLIYRPAAVGLVGDPAILDTPEFLDPNGLGDDKNRAAVAQSFVEHASGQVFSVVVNHLKSKGSPCGAGDDHPLAGSCNVTRTLAAQVLADWIDTDPTGVIDDDWLIIGDLNSYDQEDPISALQAAGYTDLIAQYQGEFAYSFVFSGEFGYLDYLMSSPSMTAQVTGATEWHVNADEPDVFDYDTSFKSDYQDSLFDPTTPFRSSDHDAAIVGLSLTGVDAKVVALPPKLWPPNHKLRAVFVFALNTAGFVDSEIVDVASSEADSGLGRGDRPNDIRIVTPYFLKLRAERFSTDGRTYTITVELNDGGHTTFDTVEVVVPHDRRGRRR